MAEKSSFNTQKISIGIVLLTMVINYGLATNLINYVLVIGLYFGIFFRILLNPKFSLPKLTSFDLIPLFFLSIWLYGVLVGYFYENPLMGIVRNFAGMTIYLIYYIFIYLKIPQEKLYKVTLYAAVINIVIALIMVILYYAGISSGVIDPKVISTGQKRPYISAGLLVIFPFVSVFGTSFLLPKSKRESFFKGSKMMIKNHVFLKLLLFFLAIYCLIFVSASKGFMLGFLFLVFFIPMAVFLKSILRFRFNLKFFLFFGFLVIGTAVLYKYNYQTLIVEMFSQDNDANAASGQMQANAVRYEQMNYLIDDLTFWGRGLGAGLSTGYERDGMGYGFELVYLNLMHKVGIFSILIFYSYCLTLYRAIKNLYQGHHVRYSATALGSMCFLFPSVGNSYLFSPVAVVLHCVALYLLREVEPQRNFQVSS